MLRKLILLILCTPLFLNAQTAFISGNDTICDNANNATVMVNFTGTPPFTFIYSINSINQPAVVSQHTPYLISTSTSGTYTLESFNDLNSVGTTSGSALVTVLESPTAIIYLASDTLSVIYSVAHFNSHQSIGSIDSVFWNFGDNTLNINHQDVEHEYLDSAAIYNATLIVQDINGCRDTAIRHVWVTETYWMYIPTSFTPDDDKKNDNFCIEYYGIRENTFLLKVYNMQGALMYQSTEPNKLKCSVNGGWNGRYYNSSKELPPDNYIYEIYFQDFEGWKHKEFGNIVLIR